jgi:hypothetical protein
MKKLFCLGLGLASLFVAMNVSAQYKAPSQYFRKDFPAPNKPGNNPAATPSQPAAPAQPPKFKDVAINSPFYFATDTNRAYPWTKLSATTAKNAKGITQTFNGEILVVR